MNNRIYCRAKLVAVAAFLAAASALGAAAADDAIKLRAMTYNIRYANQGDGRNAWQYRRDAVASIIRSNETDVAGLQEALFSQVQFLEAQLPEYAWYGVGRDDGQKSGEFSPIFYRKKRFRKVDAATFWLSQTPEQAGSKSWDSSMPRIVTCLKLEDVRTKRQFWVLNTHFDHRGAIARKNSVGVISDRIKETMLSSPVILMGDFNCGRDSEPYRLLTKDGETTFHDAFAISKQPAQGPDSTWNGFDRIVPGRVIDFVFVRGNIEVVSHTTIDAQLGGRFPSDHLPVLTELRIRPSAK